MQAVKYAWVGIYFAKFIFYHIHLKLIRTILKSKPFKMYINEINIYSGKGDR